MLHKKDSVKAVLFFVEKTYPQFGIICYLCWIEKDMP